MASPVGTQQSSIQAHAAERWRQEVRGHRLWTAAASPGRMGYIDHHRSSRRYRTITSLPPEDHTDASSRGGSSSCSQSSLARRVFSRSERCSVRSIGDFGNRMRVGVRVRPAFRREMQLCAGRLGEYWPVVTVANGSEGSGKQESTGEGNGDLENCTVRCGGRGGGEAYTKRPRVNLHTLNGRHRGFAFDYAFDPACGQQEIYRSLAAPIVTGVIDGFNGLIMAYGQTASGKSYTMGTLENVGMVEFPCAADFRPITGDAFAGQAPPIFTGLAPSAAIANDRGIHDIGGLGKYNGAHGSSLAETVVAEGDGLIARNTSDPGIIPRALLQVFEFAGGSSDDGTAHVDVSVKLSLLQIYNETVKDLLAPMAPATREESVGLHIREDPSMGFFVEGLREYPVGSHQEAAELINMGLQQRATARTAKNDVSSRSHIVIKILLEKRTGGSSPTCMMHHVASASTGCGVRSSRKSKLVLVDLAGSERAGRHGNRRVGALGEERLREAGYINGSLSALGNVVSALGKPEVDRPHIPYRDSKLTRILADSLGGNANTALIATVAPTPQNQAESLSTLAFASRCMRVRSAPVSREKFDKSETTLRLQTQLSCMQREFRTQQSRYETVITRLAQELDYAREKAFVSEDARSSPTNTHTYSSETLQFEATHTVGLAVASSGEADAPLPSSLVPLVARDNARDQRSGNGSTYTDDLTDGTDSSNEDHGSGSASIDTATINTKVLGISDGSPRRFGEASTEAVATAARVVPGREPGGVVSDAVWGSVRASARALEEVGRKGVEVLRQARVDHGVDNDTPRGNIGPHQPQSLPPPPQAHPPATTRSPQPLAFPAVAGVDMEFDKDAHDIPRSAAESARNAEELLLRIEGYRKLCHSQWDEAKAVLSSARQENVSLKQSLRTEVLRRNKQEAEARRIKCALRYLLADSDIVNEDCAQLSLTPHVVAPAEEIVEMRGEERFNALSRD